MLSLYLVHLFSGGMCVPLGAERHGQHFVSAVPWHSPILYVSMLHSEHGVVQWVSLLPLQASSASFMYLPTVHVAHSAHSKGHRANLDPAAGGQRW